MSIQLVDVKSIEMPMLNLDMVHSTQSDNKNIPKDITGWNTFKILNLKDGETHVVDVMDGHGVEITKLQNGLYAIEYAACALSTKLTVTVTQMAHILKASKKLIEDEDNDF